MRGSILSRPLRPSSRINEESVEVQHAKELSREEAKRLKYNATEEAMRKLRLNGKPDLETKQKLFDVNRQTFEEHMILHHQAEDAKRAEEEQLRRESERREMTEQQVALMQKQRKQEEARLVMEENRRLADERRMREVHSREREATIERQNLAVQEAAFSQRRLR